MSETVQGELRSGRVQAPAPRPCAAFTAASAAARLPSAAASASFILASKGQTGIACDIIQHIMSLSLSPKVRP